MKKPVSKKTKKKNAKPETIDEYLAAIPKDAHHRERGASRQDRSLMTVHYRQAQKSDIPAMARIRAAEWESEAFWSNRIKGYMSGEHHPQQALKPRVIYVALDGDSVVGFIAGHLSRRYACDGELQWINVIPEFRGSEVATELLRHLAGWFGEQNASRICVDVDPANIAARQFYIRNGAENLNEHWLVWSDISVVHGK